MNFNKSQLKQIGIVYDMQTTTPNSNEYNKTKAKLNNEGMLLLKWLTKRKADKKYNATKRHTITLSSDSSDVDYNETNNETTNDTTMKITNNIQNEHNTNEQPHNEHTSYEHNETINATTGDTTIEITNNVQYEHNTHEQPHNDYTNNEETTSALLKL
jgi:hypothetical protein